MNVRRVELDDWKSVEYAWNEYEASTRAVDAETGKIKIAGTIAQVRGLFLASLTTDHIHMLGCFNPVACRGLAILQEFNTPDIDEFGNFVVRRHCFIRSVFSLAPGCCKLLNEAVTEWAKSRGHVFISGQCRPNFPVETAAKYGYSVQHVSIGKEL